MNSVEAEIKAHFEKVFKADDWLLFKRVGEANLREAATLRKKNMKVDKDLKLLARNARKRLLIGVGVELLLKAVFLKNGYCINKFCNSKLAVKFPFKLNAVSAKTLNPADTFTLGKLIDSLKMVVGLHHATDTLRGLRIAKVFRNKEGHVVVGAHTYKAENYRSLEHALVWLYQDAFGEALEVVFAMEAGEEGRFKVSVL